MAEEVNQLDPLDIVGHPDQPDFAPGHRLAKEIIGLDGPLDALARDVKGLVGGGGDFKLGQDIGPDLDRFFRSGTADGHAQFVIALVDHIGQGEIGRGHAKVRGGHALAKDLVALGVLDQEVDGCALGWGQVKAAEGQGAHVYRLARLVEGFVGGQE